MVNEIKKKGGYWGGDKNDLGSIKCQYPASHSLPSVPITGKPGPLKETLQKLTD